MILMLSPLLLAITIVVFATITGVIDADVLILPLHTLRACFSYMSRCCCFIFAACFDFHLFSPLPLTPCRH